jgi:rhodanese-related sulfurtransferase
LASKYRRYALWAIVAIVVAAVALAVTRPAGPSAPTGVTDVGNAGFKQAIAAGDQLIDVRTPAEYATGHIPGARLLPIDQLPSQLASLDKSKPVAVYCATGARSLNAKQYLAAQGFATVVNLQAGMASWDGPVATGDQAGSPRTAAAVTVRTSGKPVFVDLFSPT